MLRRLTPRWAPGEPRTSSRRELPSVQPGSARRQKEPGFFSRFFSGLADRIALFASRPMLALCGTVLVLVLLGALFASGVRQGYALATFGLSAFVMAVIVIEFFKGTRARARIEGESWPIAFARASARPVARRAWWR